MCRAKSLLFSLLRIRLFWHQVDSLIASQDEPAYIDRRAKGTQRSLYESPHSRPYTFLRFLCPSEMKELLAENRPRSAELSPSPKNLGKERMPIIWAAKYFAICTIVLLSGGPDGSGLQIAHRLLNLCPNSVPQMAR